MEKHKVTQEYTRVDSGGASNIKVTIRARPPEDKGANTDFVEITQPEQEDAGARILIKNPDGTGSKKHAEVAYTFDNIFEQSVSQDKVFTDTCKFQIDHVMEGYNCCCFACKYIYNQFNASFVCISISSDITMHDIVFVFCIFLHHWCISYYVNLLAYRWANRQRKDAHYVWTRRRNARRRRYERTYSSLC